MSISLIINGEKKIVNNTIVNLEDLFESLSIKKEGRIVELNGSLHKNADFASVALNAGDNVEIIQFLGGG